VVRFRGDDIFKSNPPYPPFKMGIGQGIGVLEFWRGGRFWQLENKKPYWWQIIAKSPTRMGIRGGFSSKNNWFTARLEVVLWKGKNFLPSHTSVYPLLSCPDAAEGPAWRAGRVACARPSTGLVAVHAGLTLGARTAGKPSVSVLFTPLKFQ